jgi:hypothetical protein
MTDVQYTGDLSGSDGSVLRIERACLVPPSGASGPTGPTGATGPTGPGTGATGPTGPSLVPNTVKIGAAEFPLTAINPTSAAFPGGRGRDELVAYTSPLLVTVTNQWGVEAVVRDGCVAEVNDRQLTAAAAGTPIPAGAYALSGHGAARDWILAHAAPGVRVDLVYTNQPASSVIDPVVPDLEQGVVNLSTWWMIWPNSARVRCIELPDEFDELRIAFAQGTPIGLVGDSPHGWDRMQSDLKALQARGKRVSLSVGGGGGDAGTGDTKGFIDAFARIEDRLGLQLQGLNFDIESASFDASQCLRIAAQLRSDRGAGFRLSWSPNGSNKSAYLAAARTGLAGGLVDEFGQQFYDAPVSLGAARTEVSKWLAAGLKPSQCCIGMMVGTESIYWTVETCATYMAAFKAEYGIRSAYLWELSRPGTAEWARRIRSAVA